MRINHVSHNTITGTKEYPHKPASKAIIDMLDKVFNRPTSFRAILSLILAFLTLLSIVSPTLSAEEVYKPVYNNYEWISSVSLPALAVGSDGRGVVSNLTVSLAYPGKGDLYFSSEPLTMIDSQASARIAFMVAAQIAGKDPRVYDAFVSMKSPSLIIGGPSAGAVMTIGFLALFTGASINSSIAMTGMIYPDGTVGPVGGVKAKLEAAANAGYKVFLVPAGESVVMVEKRVQQGGIIYVTREPFNLTEYAKELGVRVVEVASIYEAASYFLKSWKPPSEGDMGLPLYNSEAVNLFTRWINDLENERERLVRLVNTSLAGDLLNQSEVLSDKALSYKNEGKYYIAASYMFSATALAEAAYIKQYVTTREEVLSYIETVNNTINKVLRIINSTQPQNVSSLEALVTARQRVLDAQHLLQSALDGIYEVVNPLTGEKSLVIEDASAIRLGYAKWRSIVALKWLEYSEIPSPPVTREDIEKLANDFMGLAETVVSYYTSLLEDLGVSSQESPSLSYQKGVEKLGEGAHIDAISYFMQSLADSMVGLHRVFDYKPQDIANILRDNLVKSLSRPGYRSVIALGYLEYGLESLNNFEKTGDLDEVYSAIRSFTLGSLQDALTRYLAPIPAGPVQEPLQSTANNQETSGEVVQTETTTTIAKEVTITQTVTVTKTQTQTVERSISITGVAQAFAVAILIAIVVSTLMARRRSD